MTLGEKLQTLRKQSGLSQEALAEKVAVTRQTISKWELNQSTPDLTLLAQLSDLFQVSTDYLIRDERTTPDEPPTSKKSFRLADVWKRRLLAVLSFLELAAAGICLICDYFTSDHLSWSLIVTASLAAAWVVLLPVLAAREKVVFKTLLASSLVPIPLLAVLALLLKRRVLLTLGTCIALIGIAAVWVLYGVFRKLRAHLWRAFGVAFLVMLPIPIAILYSMAHFLPQAPVELTSSLFHSGITVILSLACFGMDALHQKKQEKKL